MTRRAFLVLAALALALISFLMGLAYHLAGVPARPESSIDFNTVIERSELEPLALADGAPAVLRLEGPHLVNFWAAWCPPCVRELPLLEQVAAQCGPGSVVGLALDDLAAAQELGAELSLGFPSYVLGLEGVTLAEKLGNPSGAMPYTLMLDDAGMVAGAKIGPFANEGEILAFISEHSSLSCQAAPA